jgi:hypothetical protein
MSQYTDLYNTKKPNNDKSWTDMWANTFMFKNSNIVEHMLDEQEEYNAINDQNIALESTIQNMNSLYSTDDSKSQYQSQQTESLNTTIYVFFFIYFALLIVVAFILLFNLPTMSLYVRGAIMAAFIAYPFASGYIEMVLYMLWSYVYSILNGNVYTNGQW